MPQVIDYTTQRKGSKQTGRMIVYCPVCGKKGQMSLYMRLTPPEANIAHEAKIVEVGGLRFCQVTKSCPVKGEAFQELRESLKK